MSTTSRSADGLWEPLWAAARCGAIDGMLTMTLTIRIVSTNR
jgi:hypothetical protein